MTLAVLCPGQGAQHPGMLDLASGDPAGRAALDAAAAALASPPQSWLAPDAMFVNASAQPLICVAQYAQWQALRAALPVPAAVAGYSVGELSAYGIADAIGSADLARLAVRRAAAMDAAAARRHGGLVAVRGLRRRSVDATCAATGCHVAIAIADDAFVVGGDDAALAGFVADGERRGAQIRPLRVGVAAHTPLLDAAVAPFRAALEASTLRAPSAPVIAGIDARAVVARAKAIETLAPQIARTIEWGACLDALHERGCRVFVELTPGTALSNMVRQRFDDVAARAADEFRSIAALAAWSARAAP